MEKEENRVEGLVFEWLRLGSEEATASTTCGITPITMELKRPDTCRGREKATGKVMWTTDEWILLQWKKMKQESGETRKVNKMSRDAA